MSFWGSDLGSKFATFRVCFGVSFLSQRLVSVFCHRGLCQFFCHKGLCHFFVTEACVSFFVTRACVSFLSQGLVSLLGLFCYIVAQHFATLFGSDFGVRFGVFLESDLGVILGVPRVVS